MDLSAIVKHNVWLNVEGNTMRMRSEFQNQLKRIRYNCLGINNKNINFILCQFQRSELLYKKNISNFYFERHIERNLHYCP